jgi:hypothetical protein
VRRTWSGRASIMKAIVAPFHEQRATTTSSGAAKKDRLRQRWPLALVSKA